MKYQLIHGGVMVDGMHIPSDLANSDYAQYLRWRDGYTEEIRSPLVWSDYVPEVPATYEQRELTPFVPAVEATFDADGNELTPYIPEVAATYEQVELTPFIPAIPPQIIGGGEVIETIVHGPHTPEPYAEPRKTQAQITEAIKAERDRRKDGGTFVDGKWFHSDRDSRIQQLGLVIMGAAVPAVQWKAMDGSFITMSQTLASGIFQATAALDMGIFANAEAHIEAMKLLEDPTDYDFSTGWPAHFEV